MNPINLLALKKILDAKVSIYNNPAFIAADPISVPHRFKLKQDIEIAAFFAAMFSWGNRTTIINKSNTLMSLMDEAPYDFVLNHQASDLKKLSTFVHRTFQSADLYYFIHFFAKHYQQYPSLETAFTLSNSPFIYDQLVQFHRYFFSFEHLQRTQKHVSSPAKNVACKRLNMFLRWMVRKDDCGVDFGIWHQLKMSDLICPLDIHVCQVATRLGLLDHPMPSWRQAVKLTDSLKQLDQEDPVKYDFALFSLGAEERFR
ncbi:MAG: TIGR02757 family protein [Bacteroidetes bacterium]|nr:TIGR02757 family protein [Bacteroidota bacterium]